MDAEDANFDCSYIPSGIPSSPATSSTLAPTEATPVAPSTVFYDDVEVFVEEPQEAL